MSPNPQAETYQLHPIGRIRRGEDGIRIQVDAPYRPGLQQLDQFSDLVVFWCAAPTPILDGGASDAVL